MKLCGCTLHGGRVVQLGDDVCVLYDVGKWSDAMSKCVVNRYPSVNITVSHSPNSLTGFQVLFVLGRERGGNLSSFLVFLVVSIGLVPILMTLFNIVQKSLL